MKKHILSSYFGFRILAILVLIMASSRTIQSQDARTIISRSIDAGKFTGIETISRLNIIDQKGRVRTRDIYMASRSFDDETEKRLIIFMAPADIKGTGMLIFDYENKQDDMWMYMPALRKTRRIISSEKSKSFMGSEFSNADMAAASIEDFRYDLLGEEIIQQVECWKVRATAVSEDVSDEYGFSSQVVYIGKTDYVMRKSDYYDAGQEMIKTLAASRIEEVDPKNKKYMAQHMTMENLQNGRKSEIIMEKITLNSKLDPGIFSTDFLERQ